MNTEIRILHLEDNKLDAELVQSILEGEGFKTTVKRVESKADFLAALEAGGWDVILADYSLPSFDGRAALTLVREKTPQVPFILVSGTIGEAFAIEILKAGATDYVLKTELSGLGPAVRRAMEEKEKRQKLIDAEEALKGSEARFRGIVEMATDAIISEESPGRIILWNRKAQELFGYAEAEVLGKSLTEMIIPGKYQEKLNQGMRSFYESGNSNIAGQVLELLGRKKDGSEFPMEMTVSAVLVDGKWQVTSVIRDVSKRMKVEPS